MSRKKPVFQAVLRKQLINDVMKRNKILEIKMKTDVKK